MTEERNVTVLITIPPQCRDQLRILAAEATLKNPKRHMSGTGLAGKIVCWFLKKDAIDILNIHSLFNDNNSPSANPQEQNEVKSKESEKIENGNKI